MVFTSSKCHSTITNHITVVTMCHWQVCCSLFVILVLPVTVFWNCTLLLFAIVGKKQPTGVLHWCSHLPLKTAGSRDPVSRLGVWAHSSKCLFQYSRQPS